MRAVESRRSAVPRALDAVLDRWTGLPRAVRVVPPLAIVAFSWWASSLVPAPRPPNVLRSLASNAAHVVLFAALAAALWLCWTRRPAGQPQRWRSLGSWLLAVAYGIVDELHQAHVPGRTPSVADVLSDVAGAALATVALRMWFGRQPATMAPLCGLVLLCAASVLLATFGSW